VTLSLSVQYASTVKTLPSRAQVRRWASAAHNATNANDALITIRYVDDAEARALNHQFRGKNYATNVLTFASDAPSMPSSLTPRASPQSKAKHIALAKNYAADIVICAPVIAREAKEQRKTVHEHHAHMVIHGLLHAQGLDHESDRDAAHMESLEIAILARFRIKNPYAS
jgi:probable rRNA maturation factor